ncbi:hypothetical protein EZS27_043333, partial [termite gut metagenome]
MHFLTIAKKSFSASELQRQSGHKRYQPILEPVNKLRDAMGKRDGTYSLSGQTELDNAFITALIPDGQKDEPLRRGAGSQKQSKVVVMTESEFVENPCQGKKTGRVNHITMQIISDMRADTVTNIVKEQIDFQAELTADGSTSR